ncbi:MAG: AEC family transporter [Clostridia bacterium]|nr:AEC family transporter [Clostridia bacterium]
MNITSLLSIILTLFCLMATGFLCRKLGVITNESSKGLSKLILWVGQPMLILTALEKAEYSTENLTVGWQVTLIGFVMHLLLCVLAFFICKALKGSPDQSKIFEFSLVFANCGFIGFPILDSILGDGVGSFMGAFFVISFHLYIWTWGIMILGRGRDDIRMTVKKALVNFGTIPCLIGIAIYLLKPLFELPDFCGKVFDYLGSLCTPISVLVTGALIATIPLSKMFTNKKLYLHSAIKLIAFPIVICLLAKLVGLGDTYILLVTAMAGMPSAATVTMLGELYDIDPAYASQTVGLTSILCTFTLPVIMMLAQWIITI